MTPNGFVSIVGAGPGDPDLLTLRALRRLRAADVVLHDALVSPAILKFARRADLYMVGGRCAAARLSQEAVETLMIESARAGRRVVRLKGGDPFVFGRGGEEARALADAGVAYEVVPGISSAVAAPLLAGIPLTYRGVASAFMVIHGHDPAHWPMFVASEPPSATTLVVLMGLGQRAQLVEALGERGWGRSCPAAVVMNASLDTARVWTGTVGTLADAPVSAAGGPGVIVVGEVVALASETDPWSGSAEGSRITSRVERVLRAVPTERPAFLFDDMRQ